MRHWMSWQKGSRVTRHPGWCQGSGRCRLPGRGGQKPMTAEEGGLVGDNNRAQVSCASGRESAGAINAI
jgi:hypothetical protein